MELSATTIQDRGSHVPATWSTRAASIAHSTLARWETGATSPELAQFQRLLTHAGIRLIAVDSDGAVVEPMRADAARDRAGRRYPSHLDLHAYGWWIPP